jgi:predicted ester cyclase
VENDPLKSQWKRISAGTSRRSVLRRLGGSGIAAGAALGTTQAVFGQQTTDVSAATLNVARQALAAVNQTLATGNTSLLDAPFSPDYIDHTPRRSLATGQLQPPNLAGLKASLLELRGIVPDAVFVIEDAIASGDRFSLRLTFRGTLNTTALNVPDLNAQVLSVGGLVFGRVTGTQVSESWDYDDAAALYGFLGALQRPGGEAQPGAHGESREVANFQEVELQGIGTLLITQGDTESLTIDAPPPVLRRIETTVHNGRLTIQPSRPIKTHQDITYYLTLKQLVALDIFGAGRAESAQINGSQLHIGLSGASSCAIDALTVEALDVSMNGNGSCTLAGTVSSQTVDLSGASRYDAAKLESHVAVVTVGGASQATVRVSETLEAHVSGAGQVNYIGDPAVSQQVSGTGRVTKVG